MNQEEKIKRLESLKNLKQIYEMILQDLSKNEENQQLIDEMLEILFKIMKEIKYLEADQKI